LLYLFWLPLLPLTSEHLICVIDLIFNLPFFRLNESKKR
jgi:hypothetical protein